MQKGTSTIRGYPCGGLRHELVHPLPKSGRPPRPAPAFNPHHPPGRSAPSGRSTGRPQLAGRRQHPGHRPAYRRGARLGQLRHAHGVSRRQPPPRAPGLDMYRFQAGQGTSLTAWTSLPPGGSPVDTYLRLFDENGQELWHDDDGGSGLYSAIINYPITTPGNHTYYIGVSSYPNRLYDSFTGASSPPWSPGRGDYRLDLNLDVGD